MERETSKNARACVRTDKTPEKRREKTQKKKIERRTPLERKKRQIIERMQKLGVYKVQYMAAINRTAELYVELDELVKRYEAEGREPVVEHTNKAGATNLTKNPIRCAIDDIYTQLLAHERELGLTPAAFRKFVDGTAQTKKESPLAKAMKELRAQ